ncbi:MAG: hypothetical protein Q9M15_03865 [Mariprofundaceae bacterium]|nr:hypothetical protein [Mariprofundaceae bacterium]
MQDMEKAVQRVVTAIQTGESIHIFGDFDCDGVSGTTILLEALLAAGATVTSSIPHRAWHWCPTCARSRGIWCGFGD